MIYVIYVILICKKTLINKCIFMIYSYYMLFSIFHSYFPDDFNVIFQYYCHDTENNIPHDS